MRLIFVDFSTQLSTVTDLARIARGGMVSSLFAITDYLSSRGHDVTVLSDIKSVGATRAGTKWLHEYWGQYDVLICNRGTHDGYPDIWAKARILWTHDLPHSGFIPEPRTIRGFACTVFLSNYAERVWRAFYRDIGAGAVIPNGVDKHEFYPRQKDLNSMIFASAPNRGLERLPLIFESLQAHCKRPLTLTAYSRLSALHPGEVDAFDYGSLKIDRRDPIPQGQLANKLGQAGLMILPSGYPEICSNIVLQSLASGTPVITTGHLGATPEWVRHGKNGLLTDFLPHDYMIHSMQMIRNAARVLEDRALHLKMIKNAVNTRINTWTEIGRRWERMLRRYC